MSIFIRMLTIGSLAWAMGGCAVEDEFLVLDSNGDGSVTFEEFNPYMKKEVFDAVDTNNDNGVGQAEWQAMNPNDPISEFHQTDLNRDGAISRSEANAAFDREDYFRGLFHKVDTDGNGTLSRSEVNTFAAKVNQQPGATEFEKLSGAAK